MNIRPVASRRELGAFVRLPWRLYQDDPLWVPPLRGEVRKLLDAARHPFYDGGEAAEVELFLAWDGRDPVGRVAAILNHAHNRFHDQRVAFFGFFECIERPDVARGLLAAVEEWAARRGLEAVLGPMNPSTNYECGLLVDGFHRPPVLMMTYNPSWYPRLVEAAGYRKAKDLLAYISAVHGGSLERLERLAERTRRREPGLTTRSLDKAHFDREVKLVQQIYNSAWQRNWGFVPMSDAEIAEMGQQLKPTVHPELVRFALVDGEPVGFLLAIPDWNPVLQELDGSPLRHPLRTLKHVVFTKATDLEGLRLITLGITEPFRKRGIEGVLFAESIRAAVQLGYQWAEYSWILEDNELAKRTVRLMDGELYKTYRIYEKRLRS